MQAVNSSTEMTCRVGQRVSLESVWGGEDYKVQLTIDLLEKIEILIFFLYEIYSLCEETFSHLNLFLNLLDIERSLNSIFLCFNC